jgi:hypothetical protein
VDLRRAALEGRVALLADRLRTSSRADRGSCLSELVPDGPAPADDDHLPELRIRLARVAADPTLDDPLRFEAARLLDVANDLPSAIGHTGKVWIAWWSARRPQDAAVHPPHYLCYWEGLADDSGLLENGPNFDDLHDALTWARRRSDNIVVRPSWDPDVHYWAGQGPPPDGLKPLSEPA